MENYMINVKPNYYYRSLLSNKIPVGESNTDNKTNAIKNDKKDDYIRALKDKSIYLNSPNYTKIASIPTSENYNFYYNPKMEFYRMTKNRVINPFYNPFNDNFERFKQPNNKNNVTHQVSNLLQRQNTLPSIKYEPLDRITIRKYFKEFGINNLSASFFNSSKSTSRNSSSKSKRAITPKLELSKSNPNIAIESKKKQFMEEYYNKNSRFLNRRNKANITNLINNHNNANQMNFERDDLNEIDEDRFNENQSKLKSNKHNRIKKVFLAILAVVKLNWNVNKPEVFTINSQAQDNLFLDNDYKKENELKLADEAKELLKLKVNERTGDNIKAIVFFINFIVPEFAELPVALQYRMAQFGFYEEFEPERVIVREGHNSEKCYFIISGSADVYQAAQGKNGEVKRTLLNRIKRGDWFGEIGLINKIKRTATVVNNGEQLLGLLTFEKEHYFKMQHLVSSKGQTFDFLKNKVELFKKLEFPFEKLLNVKDDFFTIFYRKNTLICEDSMTDRWFFVIKSGKAKVLKKVKLSFEEYMDNFRMARQTTDPDIMRAYRKEEKKVRNEYKYLFDKYTFNEKNNHEKYAYLLVDTLKQGEMFGFPDMVLKDDIDYNSAYMLVSDAAECILIDRQNFLRVCPAQSFLKLRYFVQLYPNDEYFNKKYFHNFKWLDYKESFRNSITFHDPILNKNF